MMTNQQRTAHQRLLVWAEREGRIKTVEVVTKEERQANPGAFAHGNTARRDAYQGYKYGSAGKGHKPKPHQALTIKPR